LDPEAWTEIMNEVFELLMAPIRRYEGTLARLMGDAIFAFFGAPTAHEDDPTRAVSAGLEIVDAIRAYRDGHDAELNVRVGINTGPVVVGEVGSDVRVEYTAMGDAVNVAARMEQTADPGSVQITADTAGLVRGSFDLGPARDVQVRGKEDPVVAHHVLGRARPAAGMHVSGATPLVGRDHEMSILRRAVDEAIGGRGRMVALIGEPGLGKSRLIEETRGYWSARRRAATVEPGAREWLEPHMRVWRSLFGVPEPGEEPLEGEAFRSAIMDLVPRSTRYSGEEPRMLVFEDLHWCDDASMDLLIETAKVNDDQPSLMLFAFRPDEAAPSWRLKRWLEAEYPDRSTQISLTPLSDQDSGALIDELLPDVARSDAVRAGILERTQGNPLFLQELAAAIRTDGPTDAIPPTLQALITARLDTLEGDTRRTLQLASVIGRSFDEPVLGAVAGDGSELRTRLDTLEGAGLIRRTGEREYAFHHSLTQEAAYETILLRDRRALHHQVGAAMEGLFAGRLEEFAPVLAQHFEAASDDERTLRYAGLAGDHAARLYANADAIAHYDAAIEVALRLGADADLLGHLYPARGLVLQLVGRYDEAEQTYDELREHAGRSGDGSAELQAVMSLTTLYATPTPKFDVAKGRLASQEAERLAAELGDHEAESKALWNLMNLNVYGSGDPREALEAGERSLALARELDAREQIAFTMTDLWRPYVWVGDLAAARRTLEDARPIWRELDNLPMLTENLASSANVRRFTGDDDQALALAIEARSVAESIGNLWGIAFACMASAEVYLDRGDVGGAIDLMRDAIEMGERVGFLAPLATTRAALAVVYASLGDHGGALRTVEAADEVATERLPSARPAVLMALAQIHLLAGELAEAEARLAECDVELLPEAARTQASLSVPLVEGSIALARADHDRAIEEADALVDRLDRAHLLIYRPEALLLKGRALAAAGRTSEAEGTLRQARSTAERLGHRRILWEILAELGDVVDGEERPTIVGEARDIVEAMAGALDEELRTCFLRLPQVRALLDLPSHC
ncbi:MAG: hypothetical protein E6G37_03950, partial [Actinobacteria bacterium]